MKQDAPNASIRNEIRSAHRRIARPGQRCCERLESRRLLSTYVINGTPNNDSWTISADAGQITIAGNPLSVPGLDSVQVNGLAGNDILFISHTSVPITFDGGNNDDTLFVGTDGMMSGQITSAITFKGGSGTDIADCRDEQWAQDKTYSLQNGIVDWASGTLSPDAAVENVYVETGTGNETTNISNMFNANTAMVINGQGGDDTVSLDMSSSAGTVSFAGGGGNDSFYISDANAVGPITYTLDANTIHRTARLVQYAGVELLQFQGVAASAGTYNISGLANSIQSMTVLGGNQSDTFTLTATQYSNLTIDGGAGTLDTMVLDDRTQPSSLTPIFRANIDVDTFGRDYGMGPDDFATYNLSFPDIKAWTYYANNQATTINVYGTSSAIPSGQQATILCGSNADRITLYPHDANGNLTINGNLGVSGGGGLDTLIVDDTGSTLGIHYQFLNTFGPGTQNIYGMGARGFGAASDIESITIKAGDGDDTFAVDHYSSGISLAIFGAGGFNQVDIASLTGDLASSITNLPSFYFDAGPSGDGHLDIINTASTVQWSYVAFDELVQCSKPGYFRSFAYANCGYIYIGGGSAADVFTAASTPPNSNTDFDGEGGNDYYEISDTGFTSGIIGLVTCESSSGNDTVVIDDTEDTLGRIVHISPDFVSDSIGDTLFGGPDGAVDFSGIKGSVSIRLGNGGDTVYALPGTTSPVEIEANDPNVLPGDQIYVATGPLINPVYHNLGGESGEYTYDGSLGFTFSGFEALFVASGFPTVQSVDFQPDGIGADLVVQFSRDVSHSLYSNFATLVDAANPFNFIDADSLSYDLGTNTATFGFANLADGSYSASLSYHHIRDYYGNPLQSNIDYHLIYSVGTSGPDYFRIAVSPDGSTTDVFLNDDNTPAFSADYSSLNLILLNGGDDDDTFVVDTSNGNPYAIDGIRLDGGDGNDSLSVVVTDLVDNISFEDSAVVMDGQSVIHSNIENLAFTGSEYETALAINSGSVNLGGTLRFQSLSIADGAEAIVPAGSDSVLIAHSLSIAPTGILDLNDNDLIVDPIAQKRAPLRATARPAVSSDPLATIQSLINSGRDRGEWDGYGIISTTARNNPHHVTTLGAMSGSDFHLVQSADALFDDQSVSDTDVVVKFTYYGDANFNGKVDGGDYARMDLTFGREKLQGNIGGWINGDFNGDGKVDGSDFGLADLAFGGQIGPL